MAECHGRKGTGKCFCAIKYREFASYWLFFQTYLTPGKTPKTEEFQLDEVGFAFVRKCIEILENRGLEEEVSLTAYLPGYATEVIHD